MKNIVIFSLTGLLFTASTTMAEIFDLRMVEDGSTCFVEDGIYDPPENFKVIRGLHVRVAPARTLLTLSCVPSDRASAVKASLGFKPQTGKAFPQPTAHVIETAVVHNADSSANEEDHEPGLTPRESAILAAFHEPVCPAKKVSTPVKAIHRVEDLGPAQEVDDEASVKSHSTKDSHPSVDETSQADSLSDFTNNTREQEQQSQNFAISSLLQSWSQFASWMRAHWEYVQWFFGTFMLGVLLKAQWEDAVAEAAAEI